MALQRCKECGHDVSSKADACPNCGAKVRTESPILKAAGMILIAVFAVLIADELMGHDAREAKVTAAKAVPAGSDAATPPAGADEPLRPEQIAAWDAAKPRDAAPAEPIPAQETTPALPDHFYQIEEDGLYGYAQGISEDDRRAGTMTKALLMFRYLGEKNGVYTAAMEADDVRSVVSCKAPCDYVKTKAYYAGELVKTETVPAAVGSIIWGVFQDAQAGNLVAHPKGKHQ